MANFEEKRILGQLAATGSGTLDDVLSVATGHNYIISTISICCRVGGGNALVDLTAAPNGDSDDNKHYVLHSASIAEGETLFLTIGMTLFENDVLRIREQGGAAVTINVFGAKTQIL